MWLFFLPGFFLAVTFHVSYLCKLTMVPNLLDYRIGILHYLFCTWGVGMETWSPIMHWNSVFSLSLFMIFASGVFKSSFDCFLYPWHVQIGLFPKPKVYICLFSLTVKKNLIFNFNQCYFTYCRDSNLCDFRQPKYCSVQFCVWTVSVHSQQSWEFCIH